MKKLIVWVSLFFFSQNVMAQLTVKGRVVERDNPTKGIPFATITDGQFTATADAEGRFTLKTARTSISVSSVGYREENIDIRETNQPLQIVLQRAPFMLQSIEVRALRAAENAPFTTTNLQKKEIEKLNNGQDIPFLLNQTPSVVVNSDAGNGIGYTGIRIRGTDATRINMTINGIPYNDAESQGIFFVNLPDLLSSATSIQVQRGVGTSSNGAGAFGATLSISTHEFNEKPYAEFNNSFGSFNSWKRTIKAGSGLLNGKFTIDARLSGISSDGFIDRGASDLSSFQVSAAYYQPRTSFRFNLISGREKTYQAWNGIPEAKLKNDKDALLTHYYNNLGYLYFTPEDSINLFTADPRRYNVFTYNNQTDNYKQDHYQFFVNHQLNKKTLLNVALFTTYGQGYYEELKRNQKLSAYGLNDITVGNITITRTDLVRQLWLNNVFYGSVFSLQHKTGKTTLTVGGGATNYEGRHYGKVIWAEVNIPKDYQWYYLPAGKKDLNLYAKWLQQISPEWTLFGDLQWRNVSYRINGFRNNPTISINRNFNFINPKAGIHYQKGNWIGYFSYALAGKEPNRDDFEANISQQPLSETLHDFEFSVQQKTSKWNWSAVAFYMLYRNQLVLSGKINDVGAYVRNNIPRSFRRGIELQGAIRLGTKLQLSAAATLSENKIINFTEYIDDYDNGGQKTIFYRKSNIALSPGLIANAGLEYNPFKNASLLFTGKYVGKQYLDNTTSSSRMLDAFFVNDLKFSYTFSSKSIRECNIFFQLNNLFNLQYAPNGYTYGYLYGGERVTENFYYPMAGINFMSGVNIRL